MCSGTYSRIRAANVDLSQSHMLGANVIAATMGCSPGRERGGENLLSFSPFLSYNRTSVTRAHTQTKKRGMECKKRKLFWGNQLRSPSLLFYLLEPGPPTREEGVP